MGESDELWVFGCKHSADGSLIWRPDLEFDRKLEGLIRGWKRRFWQGSIDHRGTPEAPGLVVTLVSEDEVAKYPELSADGEEWVTYGVVYRIPQSKRAETLDKLDVREQNGYERHQVAVYDLQEPTKIVVPRALIYIANDQNPQWLGGKGGLDAMAENIARSVGPSGRNSEYLLNLAEAIEARGVVDCHLQELKTRVVNILENKDTSLPQAVQNPDATA